MTDISLDQRPARRFDLPRAGTILLHPRRTFQEMVSESRATWLTPMLILSVTAILVVIVAGYLKSRAAMMGEIMLPPDWEFWTPEMQNNYMQAQQATQGPVFNYIMPLVGSLTGLWVGWLLLAGLLHFGSTLLGGRGSMQIKKRGDLNVTRQIFFCELGGFDTHNQQLPNQNLLISQVSQAMRAFYDEMEAQGLSDKVTQFTLSDFGRTLNPAGSGSGVGSDHAWANHHFVVGGGITGSNFYGVTTSNGTPFPTLTLDGPDDADTGIGSRGRWIPTTAVEQYAATLARWFGLPDANLPDVFPNIINFPNTNLGFMGPA